MFSGIIEELGQVKGINRNGKTFNLSIQAPKIAPLLQLGQSISVNGVCLSVIQRRNKIITFQVMPQTFKQTNLGLLKTADTVNLERALKADGRLDGHFVTGHIDGVATVAGLVSRGAEVELKLKSNIRLMRYIVLRGCVAVDGVSLTVSLRQEELFSVHLIGHTLQNTILGFKKPADTVNLECDILAKYLEQLTAGSLSLPASSKINLSFLQNHGFI